MGAAPNEGRLRSVRGHDHNVLATIVIHNHHKTKIINDKNYYKLLAAIRSEKMQVLLDEYHKKLEELGASTPTRFFKTAKEYHEWSNYALSKGAYYQEWIEDIILKFFKEVTTEIRDGFLWYIYFGIKKPPVKSISSRNVEVANDKTKLNVKLTIHPWTLKKDIMNDMELWKSIDEKKKLLNGFVPDKRNRSKDTFDRGLRIYEIYLGIKDRKDKKTSIVTAILDSEEYKIPDSLQEKLSGIVSSYKKLLKDVNLQ